jgi:hypothetical protein
VAVISGAILPVLFLPADVIIGMESNREIMGSRSSGLNDSTNLRDKTANASDNKFNL